MTELQPDDTSGRRPGLRRRFVLFLSIVSIISGLLVGAIFVKGQVPNAWKIATGIISKTFHDAAGIRSREPVLELDLGDRDAPAILAAETGAAQWSPSSSVKIVNTSPPAAQAIELPKTPPSAEAEPISSCGFAEVNGEPHHRALINEIAWMGTAVSANDEWLELRNNSGADLPLAGWRLLSEDENQNILFDKGDVVPAARFFLLERTDDASVPSIAADKIYPGGLPNSGSWLKLIDSQCKLVDEIDASDGWTKFGGESSSRRTLERNVVSFDWHTSNEAAGTPRAQNFQPAIAVNFTPPPTPPPPLSQSAGGKININTASLEELNSITGIGPTLAQRIIDYRVQNGPFPAIENIQNVSGIGPVTFEAMKNEITVGSVFSSPPPAENGTTARVNINTAGLEELQGITGIGPTIAQRIIDYRTANGPFARIEDIKNVSGIGDVTFEKMKDEITI